MSENVDSSEIFSKLLSKIGNIFHGRSVGDQSILSKCLDDLNSLNYKYPVVKNPTTAVLLINQCCSLIPTDDKIPVEKCSKLLWNLSQQNINVEGRTLMVAIQWCLSCLRNENKDIFFNILQAMEALLRNNAPNTPTIVEIASKEIKNFVLNRQEMCRPEVILMALQCLEACTLVKSLDKNPHLQLCAETFIFQLERKYTRKTNLTEDKVIQICLFGLQNIMSTKGQDYLKSELGLLLGFVKSFMLYGIEGIDFLPPQKLMPSAFSVPEQAPASNHKKGGKLTKYRRHRSSGVHKKEILNAEESHFNNSDYIPANPIFENISGIEPRLKTSDSDFSDNEAGRHSKVRQMKARVRLVALNLFYTIVKNTEKNAFLSYWSHFIPEDSGSSQHNLVICILKDHSFKSRMAALNVLLLLLTSSKMFLSQAEFSDKSASFTPFSVFLGLTVTQLHKSLIAAMKERHVPVLIQILKCLAALVQATPYHRMSQGLLSKLVRSVKQFIYSRDACVQVTALIVLGCVLASEPVLPETSEAILLKNHPNQAKKSVVRDGSKKENESQDLDEIDFAEFSESDSEEDIPGELPWLLAKCLSNLGVTSDEQVKVARRYNDQDSTVPAPVKLESLQVISVMSRNFFEELIAPYISHITKALSAALDDKYPDLKLHAGRAIDFIGQAMNRYLSSTATKQIVPFEYYLQFWQTLFNESLINLVQSEQVILRAVGCDCLGSIGNDIFDKLPRDKQIICITLLFSCTRDEGQSVRGAAVRALGMCILYPTVKEDPGFVIDTAEAIHRLLRDKYLMVRVKASWSLGNLSESLVSMSKSPCGIEEITENLILKMLQISIDSANDHDKIKMNAVRSIGNLLLLFTDLSMEKTKIKEITQQAFKVLVDKCTTGSNTKVRWNACYALGNALKNCAFYKNYSATTPKEWQTAIFASVFNGLADLVVSYRNFKVRINAALALSTPSQREHYGLFFIPLWRALLKGLENSQNVDDFNEYKHRDNLVDQICITLAHLTTLLQTEDLTQLQETIQLNFDIFKTHTHKVFERLLPENSSALFSAADTLTIMSKQSSLSAEQKSVVENLINIFLPNYALK
nr:HEAT repeat-containing protein 6 [Leptinotarsa decemlineata]